MKTLRANVIPVRGRHCAHTFLLVGDERIRTARPVKPATDDRGRVLTASCPIPKCGRVTVVPGEL